MPLTISHILGLEEGGYSEMQWRYLTEERKRYDEMQPDIEDPHSEDLDAPCGRKVG